MLVITGTESRRVLAYVDEKSARHIRQGIPVEIRSNDSPAKVVTAEVLKVGSAIEELPVRLRRNAVFPQSGLPVLAGAIPPGIFYPGESLRLKFTRQ